MSSSQAIDHFGRAINSRPFDISGIPQSLRDPAISAANLKDTVMIGRLEKLKDETPVPFGLVSAIGIVGFAPSLPKLRSPFEGSLILGAFSLGE